MTSRYIKQKLCKVLGGKQGVLGGGDVQVANWPADTQVITFHREVVSHRKITPTPLSLYKRWKLSTLHVS